MIALGSASASGSALGAAGADSTSAWGSGEDFGKAMSASAAAGHDLATRARSGADPRPSSDSGSSGSSPGRAAAGPTGRPASLGVARTATTSDDDTDAPGRAEWTAAESAARAAASGTDSSDADGRGKGAQRDPVEATTAGLVPSLKRLLQKSDGTTVITIRVDGGHLGELRARAKAGADGVHVELQAGTPAAARELSASLDELRASISEQLGGVAVQVEVGTGSAPETPTPTDDRHHSTSVRPAAEAPTPPAAAPPPSRVGALDLVV